MEEAKWRGWDLLDFSIGLLGREQGIRFCSRMFFPLCCFVK